MRLIYDVSEQEARIETALRDAIPVLADWAADPASAPPAAQQLLLLGYGFILATLFIKNPYFQVENEWRLDRVILPGVFEPRTKVRELRGVETPYEEVLLRERDADRTAIVEIVLGPGARAREHVDDVRGLLDRNGLSHVTMRKSPAPLRDQ